MHVGADQINSLGKFSTHWLFSLAFAGKVEGHRCSKPFWDVGSRIWTIREVGTWALVSSFRMMASSMHQPSNSTRAGHAFVTSRGPIAATWQLMGFSVNQIECCSFLDISELCNYALHPGSPRRVLPQPPTSDSFWKRPPLRTPSLILQVRLKRTVLYILYCRLDLGLKTLSVPEEPKGLMIWVSRRKSLKRKPYSSLLLLAL